MQTFKRIWKSIFDVREGELGRTAFMSLYLFCVLFAYYILKSASRAMFLSKFDPDKLPSLTMLIGVTGGLLAYIYSKTAIKASLKVAVTWTMAISAICLVGFWWLFQFGLSWLLYVFNVWVSMFSIVLVSQGWLVAANVFDSRSAKRLYGPLGLGAVVGAWWGGEFTARYAKSMGSNNLLLASMIMVVLAYVAFRAAAAQKGVNLERAKAASAEEDEFTIKDLASSIGRYRHLQVIIGIIMLMLVVDTFVDFQFQTMAARTYKGDQLTAFFGLFNGRYLNLVTFPLQFFFTGALVRRLGVGGTLQVMPLSIAATSLGTALFPGLGSAMTTRLTEAAMRYTLNRTSLELLYMPLPLGLRNRTKAFVDISMDRMGRGVGGLLQQIFLWVGLRVPVHFALFVVGCSVGWMVLAWQAKKEYIKTVRQRLELRRLDLESSRVNVNDPATLSLLEAAATGNNPRQACYALSLLAEAPNYDLGPILKHLAARPLQEVRAKVYEVAWFVRYSALVEQGLAEIRQAPEGQADAALKPAVAYVLSFASEPLETARELLDHPNALVAESAVEALQLHRAWTGTLITEEWLDAASRNPGPQRRRLAALAVSVRGDAGTDVIQRLLEDPNPKVVGAACGAAGVLKNRIYVQALIRRLAEPAVRQDAVEALAAYGGRITGTLGDVLEDAAAPVAIRRHIPRVLKLVPDQRSVDILLRFIGHPDLSLRMAVLKALNSLRERAPELNYGLSVITSRILEEAQHYYELHAALEHLQHQNSAHTAANLLAGTLAERCRRTQERLFRLLGLCHPPKEIYAAYLALNHKRGEELSAALEFLESVLDRPLKRVVMPLLESSTARVVERGHEFFGVQVRDAEAAIRELIRSGDPWLVACAMAYAAEQKFQRLAPDIARAGDRSETEVAQVARWAAAALA
jgi:ATP:ADP antiporter, AAA family